jgi:hypothetical protein
MSDETVKVVHFIKARTVNARTFNVICEDMGSAH